MKSLTFWTRSLREEPEPTSEDSRSWKEGEDEVFANPEEQNGVCKDLEDPDESDYFYVNDLTRRSENAEVNTNDSYKYNGTIRLTLHL